MDFLGRLAGRAVGAIPVVESRPLSRFAPLPEGYTTGSAADGHESVDPGGAAFQHSEESGEGPDPTAAGRDHDVEADLLTPVLLARAALSDPNVGGGYAEGREASGARDSGTFPDHARGGARAVEESAAGGDTGAGDGRYEGEALPRSAAAAFAPPTHSRPAPFMPLPFAKVAPGVDPETLSGPAAESSLRAVDGDASQRMDRSVAVSESPPRTPVPMTMSSVAPGIHHGTPGQGRASDAGIRAGRGSSAAAPPHSSRTRAGKADVAAADQATPLLRSGETPTAAARDASDDPVVRISIGRIEIRAPAAPPVRAASKPRPQSTMGLAEYLRRRGGGA